MTLFLSQPRRPGFSILELLIAVIVIAVLAALALPKYNKSVEETHKREAKSNLNIIRSAEIIYKIDTKEYYPITSLADADADADNARSVLNIDLHDNEDWSYTVTAGGSGDAAAATATATRQRGKHDGDEILLDVPSGEISEYSW